MPKKGDKFIIEIAEVVKWRESHGCEQEDYLVFPFGERLVNGIELKQLTPYNPNTDDAYQRGLNDAWKLTQKIFRFVEDGGMRSEELRNAFGTGVTAEIAALPIEKVMNTLAEYEAKKKAEEEIEVGDEVMTLNYGKGIVTKIRDNIKYGKWYDVMGESGWTFGTCRDALTKTGRHFPQVAELLEAMRGDNDD